MALPQLNKEFINSLTEASYHDDWHNSRLLAALLLPKEEKKVKQ